MTSVTASALQSALAAIADPGRIAGSARFFKSEPGQYGHGDVFIGVRVPDTRSVVKRFTELPIEEVTVLLDSEIHEHRLAAVLVLVAQYERASKVRTRDDARRSELAAYYLGAVRRGRVNNWDLVDSSAPALTGDYLFDRDRSVLFELAASDVLWERRVAMIATLGLVNRGDATTALQLAALLLDDPEDLMHKAVGWVLREVGKKIDRELLIGFLDEHATRMPRTALSYATEHLDRETILHYRALR